MGFCDGQHPARDKVLCVRVFALPEVPSRCTAFAGHCVPQLDLDSFKVLKMLPTDKYIVPPLKGCSVAVIGLSKESREAVKQIVESMGGSYVKYSESPTHVIASSGLQDVMQTKAHIYDLSLLL